LNSQWDEVVEQIGLKDIAETIERVFVIVWRPFSVKIDGVEYLLHARKEDAEPPELHSIEQVELTGRAVIEVQQVALTHMRLGETRVAYGEIMLSGCRGLIVASDAPSGQQLTIRLAGAAVAAEPPA